MPHRYILDLPNGYDCLMPKVTIVFFTYNYYIYVVYMHSVVLIHVFLWNGGMTVHMAAVLQV